MKKTMICIALLVFAISFVWTASAINAVYISLPPNDIIKGLFNFKFSPAASLAPLSIFRNYTDPYMKACVENAWLTSMMIHGGLVIWIIFTMIKRPSLYGDARFATSKEVQKAGLFINPPSLKLKPEEYAEKGLFAGDKIIVGKLGGKYIGLGGQLFAYLAAPTRSGKGVGVVVPVGLSYAHSMVVSDIKQELFKLTASWRIKCGHQVFLFDPFSSEGCTARWNPLSYVSRSSALRVDDLNQIAISLIPDNNKGDSFFEDSARKLFIGIGLWLLDREAYMTEDKNYEKKYKEYLVNKALLEEIDRLSVYNANEDNVAALYREWIAEEYQWYQQIDDLELKETITLNGKKFPRHILVLQEPKPALSKQEFIKKYGAPTIRQILDLATSFKGEAIAHFQSMIASNFASEITKQTINSSISAGDKTFASILATLTSNLTP